MSAAPTRMRASMPLSLPSSSASAAASTTGRPCQRARSGSARASSSATARVVGAADGGERPHQPTRGVARHPARHARAGARRTPSNHRARRRTGRAAARCRPGCRRCAGQVGGRRERLGFGEDSSRRRRCGSSDDHGVRREQVRELIEPKLATARDRVVEHAPAAPSRSPWIASAMARFSSAHACSTSAPACTRQIDGLVQPVGRLPSEQLELAELHDRPQLRLGARPAAALRRPGAPRPPRRGSVAEVVVRLASRSSASGELRRWRGPVRGHGPGDDQAALASPRTARGATRGDPHRRRVSALPRRRGQDLLGEIRRPARAAHVGHALARGAHRARPSSRVDLERFGPPALRRESRTPARPPRSTRRGVAREMRSPAAVRPRSNVRARNGLRLRPRRSEPAASSALHGVQVATRAVRAARRKVAVGRAASASAARAVHACRRRAGPWPRGRPRG